MNKSFEERLNEAQAEVSAISPYEAHVRKQNNPDTLFIDPRSAEDINSTTGRIPGAVSIPLDVLNSSALDVLSRKLSFDKRTIITACQGGPMGAIAAHALKQHGYTNVCYVDGGTQGWLDAGYATAR